MEYVAGYTIAFDMGYRDLQYPPEGAVDWVMGKGFDATMAVGPWVVPKEEVGDVYPLRMELKVNGTVRQQGDTNDYIFRIPQILAHLSTGITLEPGRRDLAREPRRRPGLRVREREPEAEAGGFDRRDDREDRSPQPAGEGRSAASPRSTRKSATGVGSDATVPVTPRTSAPENGYLTSSRRATSVRSLSRGPMSASRNGSKSFERVARERHRAEPGAAVDRPG